MLGVGLIPRYEPDETVRLAVRAENVGFDTVFASCQYGTADPFLVLSAVADATEQVRVGPGVVNPYQVHPVVLASRMATLESITDGQAVFGLGAGDGALHEDLGIEVERPLRRVLETMSVARDLWQGDRVDHDGTFRAEGTTLQYDGGAVPTYVGAQGPDMIRMSAKYADGLLLNASHPRDCAWAAERIESGIDERSDDRSEFDFGVYASVSVAEDRAAAREAAVGPVAYVVGGAPPAVLERHGIDEECAEEVSRAIGSGDRTALYELVTDRMIDAFCIAGDRDAVADRIDEVTKHADSFVAGPPLGPDEETAIRLVADAFKRTT